MTTARTASELRKLAEGREGEIFAWDEGSVLRLFRDARAADAVAREACRDGALC